MNLKVLLNPNMAFNILLSKKASIEIKEAIDYYNNINEKLSKRFYTEFLENLSHLKNNPY